MTTPTAAAAIQTETQDDTPVLTMDHLRAEPPTISVRRAARYVGVSHTYAYQMARDGLLPTIKLGTRRIRVPTAALLRMLDPQGGGAVADSAR